MEKTQIDLKDFVFNTIKEVENPAKTDIAEIVLFFTSNDWFGIKPAFVNRKVLLTEKQVQLYKTPLLFFLKNARNSETVMSILCQKYAVTAEYLSSFYKEIKVDEDTQIHTTEFLCFSLNKELVFYNDTEISALVNSASLEMTKAHGECLTFFISWLKNTTKTAYYKDYILEKRFTMTVQNEAYDFDEYLKLLFFLFNPDYIETENMYAKAARSKNFTDTWLFLSLHYVCALRFTDLERIYHPQLPMEPEDVLTRIENDTFSDNDARLIILSIIKRMCLLELLPNKTKRHSNIDTVKFLVPDSAEIHLGKLFALAEAHYRLNSSDKSAPLIRKISTYEEITRYMGDDIGSLFIYRDFGSRSATKSYLQALYMNGNAILEESDDTFRLFWDSTRINIVSLARSHKGSFGEFAATTMEYLKDAKFNGLTPKFVAFELLERGVLSFTASTLLNMITDNEYDKQSVSNQTALIKELNMTPLEIDNIVSIVSDGRQQAINALEKVIHDDTDILYALHKVASGEAFSKQPESLCLLSAINKTCPYSVKRQCIGCPYEISTKSTFYLMIGEYNRLFNLLHTTSDKLEKSKYKQIIQTIILPKLDEALTMIKLNYGDNIYKQYEELIKENT